MNVRSLVFCAIMLATPANALACERYVTIPREQMRELTTTLRDQKADEIERLQAYATLSCSEDPGIRDIVLREAMKKGNSAVLRGRALLDLMASKANLVVLIGPATNADRDTQVYVQRHNGALTLRNRYVDKRAGCIGLSLSDKCDRTNSLVVAGSKVELSYSNDNVIGQLELVGMELVGQIPRGSGAFVPARIRLE